MPLHPIAQNLVDARLPTRAHGSEMPKHLRRESDVDVHLRIGLSGATARTRERALRRTHYLAADRDLGTLELLLCPLRRIVRVNPEAPRNVLFPAHCISSSK
jgi:hypothetical protein